MAIARTTYTQTTAEMLAEEGATTGLSVPAQGSLEGVQTTDATGDLAQAPVEGEQAPQLTGRMADVYTKHQETIPDMEMDLGEHQWSVDRFSGIWEANRERYERVAAQTDVPAELVAALHFRESGGNFNTYLHNGQPLGQVTTIVPKGVYFTDWEEAAVDAMNRFAGLRDELEITAETEDLARIATFAEHYNGLGYDSRGVASPYVYSGTDEYSSGKYVRDGVYDPNTRDRQLGVLPMVMLARGDVDATVASGSAHAPRELGSRVLRQGMDGTDVRALQELLVAAGHEISVDGDFGPATLAAVRAFQAAAGIAVDGVVGPGTLGALRSGGETTTGEGVDEAAETTGTPRPDGDLGTGILRRGARGGEVRALQEMLVWLGHDLAVDGDFGRRTEAALRAFQESAGIEVDGVVGPQTRGALTTAQPSGSTEAAETTEVSAEDGATEGATETVAETSGGQAGGDQAVATETATGTTSHEGARPAPTGTYDLDGQRLRVGDSGDAVEELQRLLRDRGHTITVDGDFGPQTNIALRRAQAALGLPTHGILTRDTLAALRTRPGLEFASRPEGEASIAAEEEPSWMRIARAEMGRNLQEYEGRSNNNERIVEYHQTTTLAANDDETAWCASFVNWVMEQAGYGGNGSAASQDWGSYGQYVDTPVYGAIGVINWSRSGDKSHQGHVGFVVGRSGDTVTMLGGNQGNTVKLSNYDIKNFMAFVLPDGYVPPEEHYTLQAGDSSPVEGYGATR